MNGDWLTAFVLGGLLVTNILCLLIFFTLVCSKMLNIYFFFSNFIQTNVQEPSPPPSAEVTTTTRTEMASQSPVNGIFLVFLKHFQTLSMENLSFLQHPGW